MGNRSGFFYDLLNRPLLFNALRSILDGGQVRYMARILGRFEHDSVLDVGCGCGAFSRASERPYTGIDYNERYIRHARRKYGGGSRRFVVSDARGFFPERDYDVSIIVNSIHHFPDDEVVSLLKRMNQVTRKLVVVHDLVPRSGLVSKFFYRIDRGAFIRSIDGQRRLIGRAGLEVREVHTLRTFPGIYLHSTFVCASANTRGEP